MAFFLAAAAAVSVASTAFGFFSKRKAAGKLEQANELASQAVGKREQARKVQARVEALKLARQRRAVSREARAARGQALQAGGSSGASVASAGIAGGIGGVESSAAASQSFLGESGIRAKEISNFLGEAATLQTEATKLGASAAGTAATGEAVTSAGSSLASLLSSFK